MTENIREQISALLDGELPQHEMRQAVDRLSEQEPLQERWDRYHLIRDVIRGDAGARSAPSVAERVRAELEHEPAILAAPKPPAGTTTRPPAWVRPFAGTALAASVAVLAVLAAPQLLNPEAKGPAQTAALQTAPQPNYVQLAPAASPAPGYRLVNGAQYDSTPYRVRPVVVARPAAEWSVQYPGTRWNLAKPATESKLNKYLVDHSQYATRGPVRGVVPYATFVGYDARQ